MEKYHSSLSLSHTVRTFFSSKTFIAFCFTMTHDFKFTQIYKIGTIYPTLHRLYFSPPQTKSILYRKLPITNKVPNDIFLQTRLLHNAFKLPPRIGITILVFTPGRHVKHARIKEIPSLESLGCTRRRNIGQHT